jgi:hypothetical protein
MQTNMSTTQVTLPIGTISHGTMRERDIVPKFLAALRAVNPAQADELEAERPAYHAAEMSYWLNETLWDAMNDACPANHYFGAHPGDGSDYGVWPIEVDAE